MPARIGPAEPEPHASGAPSGRPVERRCASRIMSCGSVSMRSTWWKSPPVAREIVASRSRFTVSVPMRSVVTVMSARARAAISPSWSSARRLLSPSVSRITWRTWRADGEEVPACRVERLLEVGAAAVLEAADLRGERGPRLGHGPQRAELVGLRVERDRARPGPAAPS